MKEEKYLWRCAGCLWEGTRRGQRQSPAEIGRQKMKKKKKKTQKMTRKRAEKRSKGMVVKEMEVGQ